MSGAELVAVLGVAASVIQVWECCVKIAKFIQNCSPKGILEDLGPQVCLLACDIEQLKNLNLNLPPDNLLSRVLFGCQQQLKTLSTLIEEYHKFCNMSRSKRLLQAPGVPKREKEIKKIWTIICEYRSTIILHLSIQTANKLLLASENSPDDPSLFLVPWERPSGLVGRQDVLDTITHSIRHSTSHPCIISLTGIGGIGKTMIATEFCNRVRHQYPMIAWIVSIDESSVTQGILKIANALSGDRETFTSREESLEFIQELSRKRRRPWLYVFDDYGIATLTSDIFRLTASDQNDVVLITQRARTSWGIQIEVPLLPEGDAEQLLLRNSLLSSRSDELEAAAVLARELGGLPLALDQVGQMVKAKGITYQEFLQNFQGMKHTKPRSASYPTQLIMTIRLSFDSLRKENTDLFDFLLQLSAMGPTAECTLQDFYLIARANGDSFPSFYKLFLCDGQWSSELFLEAIMQISAHGLVSQGPGSDGGLLIRFSHILILEELQREILRDEARLLQLIFQGTSIIAAPLTTHDWEVFSFGYRDILLGNAMQILRQQSSHISGPDQTKAYSGILEGYRTTIAAFLGFHGREQLAKDLLLDSLRLQSAWLGESATLTCTTVTCLILLHSESMDLDEAEILVKRLTAAESQGYTNKHIPFANSLLLSGQLQMRRNNLEAALSIFKECTELHAYMDNDFSRTGAASSLVSGAEVLLLQGNLNDATQNIYDAECIGKLTGGLRSLDIRIKWNLARISSLQCDYARAISRYQDLIEEYRKHYGSEYQRWRTLHCELGDVYRNLGDVQKAEYHYRTGGATASRMARVLMIDSVDISQLLLYGSLMTS